MNYQGFSYHVQTEDWGKAKPYFVSRIFLNGAVVKSIKTPYQDILPGGTESPVHIILLAMKSQHEQILDLLHSGQLL